MGAFTSQFMKQCISGQITLHLTLYKVQHILGVGSTPTYTILIKNRAEGAYTLKVHN
jgi:hypothetical protein